jgi:hypothetical protein
MNQWLRLTGILNILGVIAVVEFKYPASFTALGLHPSARLWHDVVVTECGYFAIIGICMAVLSWKIMMRQVRRDREAPVERISLRHP